MGVRETAGSLPDFKTLFEAVPGCFLVLAPDPPRFTILAASDDYLRATKTRRKEIVGRGVFEVFPDNPRDPSGAEANSRASFERVIQRRVPDQQALQQHDIRRQGQDGAGFETRFWSPLNSPVLGEGGQVRYIIHRVEDVTELVRLRQQAADAGAAWTSESARAEAMARLEVSLIRREADAARERESRCSLAEETLRRFELLARHSRDIFLFMRRDDGRLLEANEAAINAYGYSRQELLELTIHDLRAPETRTLTSEQMAGAGAQGVLFETRHRRRDGSSFPVEVSSQGASVAGTPTLISVIRDISQREQAEEALRLSEEKFATVFRSSSIATCLTRIADSRIIDANPAFTEVSGYSREEFSGRTILELGLWPTPEDRAAAVEELRRHGFFRNRSQTMRTRSGEMREFVASAEMLTIGGEPTMLSTWLDITERKQAEEALRQSEHFYRQTLESIPGMVFTTRPDGFCDYQSQQWVEYTGVDACEHLGQGWNDLLHPDDRARALEAWRAAVAGRAPYDLEYRVRRRDGRYEWFKVRGVPIADADGQIARWFGVAANIDGIKRAEQELAAAKAAAERDRAVAESANRAKDQFIAVLSHELRTPLTPAVAAMSLLRTDVRLPADVRETLALVSRNLDLEVRLIADLLDVSRAISGKLHLEKRPVDVAAAIREAAAIIEHDLEARGQTLTVETPAAPYLALGDAARLQQVFWNLLRNSVKFSPPRSRIAIRARLVPVERCPLASQPCSVGAGDCPLPMPANGDGRQHGGNLMVEVVDQGSGIDPRILPRLFNVFEQGQEARTFGGLGLGLSICKAIVEMHGGTISAHSDGVGLGATFTVRLPVVECALAKEGEASAREEIDVAPALAPDGRGSLRVLLVEDHEDTAEMMELLLARMGHEVVTAGSVAEALAAVAEARPELLISDLGLPDASGLDLIRELLARGDHIPAIALSGYGTPADIEKSKAAGFVEHLVKPLNGAAPLAAAIERLGVRPGRRA